MNYVGIDIGSTASKTVIRGGRVESFTLPTGWNSKDTAESIRRELLGYGVDVQDPTVKVVATGYGRISVDYADKIITEITCHGRGGSTLAGGDCTVIDVGGQDTKVITVTKGSVTGFLMNDKCSAGTGKFIEIMANRLGVTIEGMFDLAKEGTAIPISSMCTVFAESEVISYIGEGRPREDIAAGAVDSVVSKVALLAGRHGLSGQVLLTGGLSGNAYFADCLGKKLGQTVKFGEEGRYAGALGAAILAEEKLGKTL